MMDAAELIALAKEIAAEPYGHDNALDVRVDCALFEPYGDYTAIRPNDAGTKIILTKTDGTESTHWADEWTANREGAAAALRARAATLPAVFAIVDLRPEWKARDPYISLWRANNSNYAWPLIWAGRYTKDVIDAHPGYYFQKRYPKHKIADRFPVPWHVVERLAVPPAPGRIDGDAGPVLLNDGRTRRALRRAMYRPPNPLTGDNF